MNDQHLIDSSSRSYASGLWRIAKFGHTCSYICVAIFVVQALIVMIDNRAAGTSTSEAILKEKYGHGNLFPYKIRVNLFTPPNYGIVTLRSQ